MSEFSFLADVSRERRGVSDRLALAQWLARTPCGPLYKRHGSPDRELVGSVSSWMQAQGE